MGLFKKEQRPLRGVTYVREQRSKQIKQFLGCTVLGFAVGYGFACSADDALQKRNEAIGVYHDVERSK